MKASIRSHNSFFSSICLLLLAVSTATHGQVLPGMGGSDEETVSEPASVTVPSALSSPAATFETFTQAMDAVKDGQKPAMEKAISTLDVSGINALVRNERGEELAWTLAEILQRTPEMTWLQPPAEPGYSAPWVMREFEQGKITLARISDGRWLFSRETLENLPKVLDALQAKAELSGTIRSFSADKPVSLALRQAMPEWLRKKSILLEHWQWLGIVLVIFGGLLADRMVSLVLSGFVRRWRSTERARFYGDIRNDLLRPFALMAMAGVWWAGLNVLSLPDNALAILLTAAKFLTALSWIWGAYRLTDLLGAWLKEKAAGTETKVDDILVPLFTKSLKVLVTVMGIVFLADTLSMNITGLLAGLGLGGLAFALAAKDMVENLFGSVTVILDRPYTVGDWVVIDGVEGTVEDMGFRSTRIRTFYNSLVSMPNSRMITAHVDNMGKRRYRRFKTTFGLTYDTPPAKIDAFCEGVRELVRKHPLTRKDYFHVYLNNYGGSSLDIMIYIFFQAPDWGAELNARHEFLLDCLRLAQKLEVEFAFPSRTLYMRKEEMPSHMDWGELDTNDIGQAAARDVMDREM